MCDPDWLKLASAMCLAVLLKEDRSSVMDWWRDGRRSSVREQVSIATSFIVRTAKKSIIRPAVKSGTIKFLWRFTVREYNLFYLSLEGDVYHILRRQRWHIHFILSQSPLNQHYTYHKPD